MSEHERVGKRLVCGVGINDADYVVQVKEEAGYVNGKRKRRLVWVCPFYQTWKSMLVRCYSDYKYKYPTYKQSSVTEEWHLFSTFKSWMETQDYEGKHLDKDLLVQGNKVYSPETCVFVSVVVNSFLTERDGDRGDYTIGVYWYQRDQKFIAQCSNPFTKKRENLGAHTTEISAHKAWLKRKLELAHALAAVQTDERVACALVERYTNYKEQGKQMMILNNKEVE